MEPRPDRLIRLLSETGLVGTSLFLIVLFYPIFRTSNIVQSLRSNDPLAASIFASYIGLVFASLARFGPYFDLTLWLMFALALGTGTCKREYLLVRETAGHPTKRGR